MPITVSGISAILADGVRETTQTTGTGNYSLDGPAIVEGITYRTFVAGVGSGNATVYTVRSGSQYETTIGTVTSGAPATLTRSVILSSSNANSAVSWGSGVKDIYIDSPAAVFHSLQAQIDNMLSRVKVTTFTVTGTFTTDADCLFALVRIAAGGGAGGGTQATDSAAAAEGGGGGGGEYAEGYFTAAQLGVSKSIVIGAGGTPFANGNGGNGGITNFGAGLLTANGGEGGLLGAATINDFAQFGGGGGTGGSGGFLRVQGGWGGLGVIRHRDGLGIRGTMAWGGSSVFGHGVHWPTDTVADAAQVGRPYGAGGTGASTGQNKAADAGGAGAAGVCIIVEYCKA